MKRRSFFGALVAGVFGLVGINRAKADVSELLIKAPAARMDLKEGLIAHWKCDELSSNRAEVRDKSYREQFNIGAMSQSDIREHEFTFGDPDMRSVK